MTAGHCSETSLVPIFTRVLTAVENPGIEGSCLIPPQRCSNCSEPPEINSSIPFSNKTNCTEYSTNSKSLCCKHMNNNSVVTTKGKLLSIWIGFPQNVCFQRTCVKMNINYVHFPKPCNPFPWTLLLPHPLQVYLPLPFILSLLSSLE